MGILQMPNQPYKTVARRVKTDFSAVQIEKLEHTESK